MASWAPGTFARCLSIFCSLFAFRTMARTFRPVRTAAVITDTPMLPVAPMTRTVSDILMRVDVVLDGIQAWLASQMVTRVSDEEKRSSRLPTGPVIYSGIDIALLLPGRSESLLHGRCVQLVRYSSQPRASSGRPLWIPPDFTQLLRPKDAPRLWYGHFYSRSPEMPGTKKE